MKCTLAGTVNVILIISSQEASLSKQAKASFNNCFTDCRCFSYLVIYIANTFTLVLFCQKNSYTELWQSGLLMYFINIFRKWLLFELKDNGKEKIYIYKDGDILSNRESFLNKAFLRSSRDPGITCYLIEWCRSYILCSR